jgi:hypothetical protein
MQRLDEATGDWVNEGNLYSDVSDEYPDDQEPKVRKKRDRIEEKAKKEK